MKNDRLGLWEAEEQVQKLHGPWWSARVHYFPKSLLNDFNVFVTRLNNYNSAPGETKPQVLVGLIDAANNLVLGLKSKKESKKHMNLAVFGHVVTGFRPQSSYSHPVDDLITAIYALFKGLGHPEVQLGTRRINPYEDV